MPRIPRVKRAPNREPTSLAATTLTRDEAVETIESFNINPNLTNIDQPPRPTPLLDSQYPPLDSQYPPLDSQYPPPNSDTFEGPLRLTPTPPPCPSLPSLQFDAEPQPFSRWTIDMEGVLFNTLCEQATAGKRADSGFKKEAWIACCDAILVATNQIVTIDQCKGKSDTQKGYWRDFNWLKDQSGFGYDENTGLITAGEQAWRDVIKVRNIDTSNNLLYY